MQENIINGNTLGEAELESQLGEKRSCSRSLDEQILPNSLIQRPNFWVIMSEQNVCSAGALYQFQRRGLVMFCRLLASTW